MPTVPADSLELIARDLLMGAGATEHEAASVAEGVVGANLAGHDFSRDSSRYRHTLSASR